MRAHIGTKFLDLRDCEDPRFKTINCQLDQIVWWMQGRVFQLALTLTGKKHRVLPIWWSRRWEYPWAILAADLKPGEEGLDCGCGGSPLLSYLSRQGIICTGVDKGVDNISLKGKLLRMMGYRDIWGFAGSPIPHTPPIRFLKEDITDLNFEGARFECVFSISVLEHLTQESQLRAADEMSRVLKPGGKLIVTMDVYKWDLKAPERFIAYCRDRGIALMGELEEVPQYLRHEHTYDVVGLILTT